MFDFTDALHELIHHITENCPKLKHIRPDEVALSFIQTRSPGMHGVYASVQPLRFENGADSVTRRGRVYTMPPLIMDGREMLYIAYFALPRFADLSFELKMTTVFHELYHIGPNFDGDIRRFKGRNYAHGHSRKKYNEYAKALADAYMATPGAEERTAFLHMNYDQLKALHGSVGGMRIRPPRVRLSKAS